MKNCTIDTHSKIGHKKSIVNWKSKIWKKRKAFCQKKVSNRKIYLKKKLKQLLKKNVWIKKVIIN